MRRHLSTLLAGALVATAIPLAATAAERAPSHPYDAALDVDAEASKAAMTAAREKVEAALEAPTESVEYFHDRPFHYFHPEGSVEQRQPDGTTFAARVLDVEEGGGQATLDDRLITRGEDGWWRYGTREPNGRITATDARVGHDPAPAGTRVEDAPAEFFANIRIYEQYEEQLRQFIHARNAGISREVIAADEQVVFRIPALLFQVNNEPFQEDSTPEKFEALYSGIGTSETGTTTEMYLEQSFGNMLIQLDVYGPYTQSISNNPANDCWYGTDGGPILGDFPEPVKPITGNGLGLGGYGAKGMATEAVPQSDPDVDYRQYDQDGNNYVDFLMIIHSGPGAETTGDPCDVHSHYFSGIGPAFGAPPEPTPVSADGVLIGPVLTVPELDAAIGVVSHEIMHALGEPDYYGTAGTAGTGDWDLGAGGSYGGIPTQTNPLHFNPVMKINFGWIEPTRIDGTALDQALSPRSMYPDLLQVPIRIEPAGSEEAEQCDRAPISIVPSQNNAFYDADGNCLAEGFLIENYQRAGAFWDRESCTFTPADFDRQGYASGLMIWHWDFENYESLGNNNVLRPMLDIEEFDRRFGTQDLEQNVSRGDPMDPFWGDPVGISSATGEVASDAAIPPPPEGSPYTVVAPVPGASTGYTPDWTVPASIARGVVMEVVLSWDTEDLDDYDLAVEEKLPDGTYVQVASDGAFPGTGPESVAFAPKPGVTYRAAAHNYASVSTEATATVTYSGDGILKFAPANTTNALFESTGWQFTNIRPNDYRGLAHAGERAETPIVLDLIKHDDTTLDVSGDFLEVVRDGDFTQPVIAGSPVTLRSQVYNHGGKAVSGATFEVYDADPATGAAPIVSFTKDLPAFTKDVIELQYTPKAGLNELYVTASAPGDLVAGNNVVRTELEASPAGEVPVLIVDNDRGWATEQTVEANLLSLGVPYHIVEGEPSAETLSRYDAAIWLTSTVSGAKGVLSAAGWDELTTYLDQGGQVWLASDRAGGYAGNVDVQREGALARYFGLVGVNNILDPMGEMVGTGDAIGGERTIPINYVDGRPYLDYFEPVPDDAETQPLAEPALLFTHEARPEYFLGARLELTEPTTAGEGDTERTVQPFKAVSTPSLTIVQRAADQRQLTSEVLEFFGIATGSPSADPQVVFNRFQHVQVGEDWVVPIGATGVDGVELRYRTYGTDVWETIAAEQVAPALYEATIPGSEIFNNGIEYHVRTVSGGTTTVVDEGDVLPNLASAPYGTPEDTGYGVCAAAAQDDPVSGDGASSPLPATGGGLALLGLLAIGGAVALRRRGIIG